MARYKTYAIPTNTAGIAGGAQLSVDVQMGREFERIAGLHIVALDSTGAAVPLSLLRVQLTGGAGDSKHWPPGQRFINASAIVGNGERASAFTDAVDFTAGSDKQVTVTIALSSLAPAAVVQLDVAVFAEV